MKLKCQNCQERATLHITEIDGGDYRELHLCYRCAQKYLHETDDGSAEPLAIGESAPATMAPTVDKKPCPVCKSTFEDFRSSGRLGCPHDYEHFRSELRPLIENIHGALRHIGKAPRRAPADSRAQTRLIQLRQEMQQAITVEDYERAARLRDEIELIEKGAERPV